jgi:hypothetical protein
MEKQLQYHAVSIEHQNPEQLAWKGRILVPISGIFDRFLRSTEKPCRPQYNRNLAFYIRKSRVPHKTAE